ncbi:hypothetical protein BGY98DRAFT_937528 [Russula aff. rugulosa BPL654]|nr:hypothetical protein BGY98DRAFT_937528 [Russula aff. rugulosa BPL654]
MAGIVPALSVASASPAAPALSSRDRSPQSARGSDVSQASRPVRSLPTRTGAPRLVSSLGSNTAATAIAAAAAAPTVTVPAAVSSIMALSVPVDPVLVTSVSEIDPNVGDRPDHACMCCSQRRQKCAIPEGRDPLDTSEPCLRCVQDKKVCDWTREAVVLKRPAGGVKCSARLARKASHVATAFSKRPSPSLSMKFPDEVPVWPTQGTEQASLQELLTWHVEVAASYALLVHEKIVAQEVGVADDRRQYAWDRYRRLAGLSALGEPLVPPPRPSSP